jgi:hypothetical protein
MTTSLATDPLLPNDLRWLLALRLFHLQPWFLFRHRDEYEFASHAFANEDMEHRTVLTFARRYDCDDFAGLEIVHGSVTSRMIYFHPVFNSSVSPVSEPRRTWDICCGTYPDVFAFLSDVVVPAMRDWALCSDASEIDPDYRDDQQNIG